MLLLLSKGALAIAAVIDIALNGPLKSKALSERLGLPARHLEPLLQPLARHGILKSTRGPRGGYELAREQRRITADDILRATAAEMYCTPLADSELLKSVVLPVLAQAEEAFPPSWRASTSRIWRRSARPNWAARRRE